MEELSEQWGILHSRIVCGEDLTASERAIYDEEMARFDASESYPASIEEMRTLRNALLAAEDEQKRLLEQSATLRKRIREMETRLDKRTQERLGVGVS